MSQMPQLRKLKLTSSKYLGRVIILSDLNNLTSLDLRNCQ
jgi:hypothetical protein